jgi:hypothetical protein
MQWPLTFQSHGSVSQREQLFFMDPFKKGYFETAAFVRKPNENPRERHKDKESKALREKRVECVSACSIGREVCRKERKRE